MIIILIATPLYGKTPPYQVAVQTKSLAPNAGGQDIYSLKISKENLEVSIFSNQNITAGNMPFSGATISKRFSICNDQCFWQFFIQLGAGGSNGGPISEMTWGTIIPFLPLWLPFSAPKFVPALRIDITTQIAYIRWRAVTWTYPFWVGISVPI